MGKHEEAFAELRLWCERHNCSISSKGMTFLFGPGIGGVYTSNIFNSNTHSVAGDKDLSFGKCVDWKREYEKLLSGIRELQRLIENRTGIKKGAARQELEDLVIVLHRGEK